MNEFVQNLFGGWIHPSFEPAIIGSLQILLIFTVGLALTWATRVVFRRLYAFVHRMDERLGSMAADDARRINTLLGVVQTLCILTLWSILVVMMLSQAGVNVGPILAGAGILGVALGFGAQHLVRDLITGFFIILENHVRLGDVALINGTAGMVERITYRVIVLRDLEGVVHVFPHGQINTLANMTKDFSYALMEVGVAYKEDPDRVIALLRREGERMAAERQWANMGVEAADVLGVEALADSAVVIKLRIKTKPSQQWMVKREFLKRVKATFNAEGIEIPFPQRSVYLATQRQPLPVRVEWSNESTASTGGAKTRHDTKES